MARPMSEEKKQRMLTEKMSTLIPAMAVPTIVAQHIVNKQVVTDYTIGAAE